MNRKTLWTKVFCILVAVMVFGALNAGAQTVLKFSHTDQQQGARQAAALFFAKKVEEYTNGRYKVQVFCCSQIGNDPKNIEQLALGGIDFTVSSTGSYAPHVDTLNLTMLPFLVETYDQGWKLYDESKWLQAQFDKAPAKGFRFLSTFEAGFRCMTTRDPLNTPADAKGKKLRTFPNEMMRWTLEDIGFSVQIMPLPEVYMAIQQGVVSGQENPIDTIYSNKFYEVAPNVTLTQHVYSPIPLAISEKTWQKLSESDRQAVTKAAKEAAVFSRQEIRANDDRQLKEMADKGAKIARPNLEPFRQVVQPAYAKAREKFGAENVDAILKEFGVNVEIIDRRSQPDPSTPLIPPAGRVITASNHPLGGLDGMAGIALVFQPEFSRLQGDGNTVAGAIFTIPAFVMVNVNGQRLWTGFNYWETSFILLVGGVLGGREPLLELRQAGEVPVAGLLGRRDGGASQDI